jgi:predicted DNA-binding transcriptional regulator YafY
LEEQADRSLVMRGQVSGLDGIRTELLRWGSPVTVLEPPALREALLKEAEALVKKYQENF